VGDMSEITYANVIDRESEEWKSLAIKPFSPNQLRALTLSTAPFNLWDGSIRSGKTFLSIAWLLQMNQSLPKGDGMILGQTPDTIERNFLNSFMELLGEGNYHYKTGRHIEIYYYNAKGKRQKRRFYIVGARDVSAVRRIRGSTLMIAYIDEGTLIPQVVFDELVGRLSHKQAKCLVTTNPDSPHHWLLKNYVENTEAKVDWRRFKFLLQDNLSLDLEYIERIKRQYRGIPARYQRMILGRWVIAEGVIYQVFKADRHVVKSPPIERARRVFVGADYGVENPTVFLIIGEYMIKGKKTYYVLKEYSYSGREKMKAKTTSQFAEDFAVFIKDHRITEVVVDPSAKALIIELERADIKRKSGSMYTVSKANNNVLDGIQHVANLIYDDALFILDTCKVVIEELQTYSWNPKAQEKGIDEPIKDHDHALDALRYALFTLTGKGKTGVISNHNIT
jgi:PBSX family phage terminase large subunit